MRVIDNTKRWLVSFEHRLALKGTRDNGGRIHHEKRTRRFTLERTDGPCSPSFTGIAHIRRYGLSERPVASVGLPIKVCMGSEGGVSSNVAQAFSTSRTLNYSCKFLEQGKEKLRG